MATRETRTQVGLRAPTSRPAIRRETGCTAHWNGPRMGLRGRPHSECRARWQGIQRYHMNTNGWADVAYTFAVCHHGIAMDGRGKGVRTAANGTNAGNDAWYACFFMVGDGEEPSREMLAAAEWYARVHLGVTRWNRHKDHKATVCAGTVDKYVVNGRLNVAGAAPSGQATGGSSAQTPGFITVGDRGPDVRAWQVRLLEWDPRALPRFGDDGDFGEETRTATVRFMREVGLISRSADPDRPQVGPATRKAMGDLLAARRQQQTPKEPPVPTKPGPYPDVPADHTFADEIARAKELGLMQGRADGTFGLGRTVTREVLAAVAVRLFDAIRQSLADDATRRP